MFNIYGVSIMEDKLSILQQVELRDIWEHEAQDFTKWLAEATNIKLLANTLNISVDLEEIRTEYSIGIGQKYKADIVLKDKQDKFIIIENQLESTDHDHLGQIITYASGIDANTIIWLVKDANDAHLQAIEWLNEKTTMDINFFLVKIKLFKIDHSKPAPLFEILVKPNNWIKEVNQQIEQTQISDTKLRYQDFWIGFKSAYPKIATQKARPEFDYRINIGHSKSYLVAWITTQNKIIGFEFVNLDNNDIFDFLLDHLSKIKEGLGVDINLRIKKENVKQKYIQVSKEFDINNRDNWKDAYDWYANMHEKFKKVFLPLIKEFNELNHM